KPFSKLGVRRAILNDLAPAASFIAYNYNTPADVVAFESEAKKTLASVERECGWMYQTRHAATPAQIEEALRLVRSEDRPDLRDIGLTGRINYTVWSDVFTCPECAGDVVFWDAAVDEKAGAVRDEFDCPHCSSKLTKRGMERAWVSRVDDATKQPIRQAKQ